MAIQEVFIPIKGQLYRVAKPHTVIIRKNDHYMGYLLNSLGYMRPPTGRIYYYINYWGEIEPKFIKNDNKGEYVEVIIPEDLNIFITVNNSRNRVHVKVQKKYNKGRVDGWKKVSNIIYLAFDKANIALEPIAKP